MSITKNYKEGNQGSDFNYRSRVLRGLAEIAGNTDELSSLSGLSPKAKTPTSVASTGVTNIPAGATEISIFNNGTGDATVNGVVCPPGVTRNFGMRNPTSAVIVCDGGGTEELIIDYMA